MSMLCREGCRTLPALQPPIVPGVFRFPSMRACVLPATPTLKFGALTRTDAVDKPPNGRCPLAPASSLPRLPRFACAALRYASPFPLSLRFVARVGDPPLLAVATPRVRHVAFGM